MKFDGLGAGLDLNAIVNDLQKPLKKHMDELKGISDKVIDFGENNPQLRHVDIIGVYTNWLGRLYVETKQTKIRLKGISLEDAKKKMGGV